MHVKSLDTRQGLFCTIREVLRSKIRMGIMKKILKLVSNRITVTVIALALQFSGGFPGAVSYGQ